MDHPTTALVAASNQSTGSGQETFLFRLDRNRFTVVINGYIMPLVAVTTLVTNGLVLAILLRRQMRSPTNILLVALAISDSLTSACPLPCFVHFYTFGQRYLDWVPFSWCFAYFCLTDYLPTVFHTASIWLTVSLAVQRYVRVCCPVGSTARRWLCSMKGTVYVIVGVYASAVTSQLCRFTELTFNAVKIPSLMNSTSETEVDMELVSDVAVIEACRYELTPFVARYEIIYFNVYYWSRVLLIHVIPCSTLVPLNASLILKMQAAHRRRSQMIPPPPTLQVPGRLNATVTEMAGSAYEMQHLASPSYTTFVASRNASRRVHGSSVVGGATTRTTMMLVIVVGVFLLVEVPLSVLLLLVIAENTFDVDLFSDNTRYTAALFVNFFIAVTYPLNLFVYCAMSERFRRMFCALFRRSASLSDVQSSGRRDERAAELD